jgi:hypothetical protein
MRGRCTTTKYRAGFPSLQGKSLPVYIFFVECCLILETGLFTHVYHYIKYIYKVLIGKIKKLDFDILVTLDAFNMPPD